VLVSNAPASRLPAGCSDYGSFAVMLVLEGRDKCFVGEEVETVIVEEGWVASDNVRWRADLLQTKSHCSLAGYSVEGNSFVQYGLAFGAERTTKDR
jgi:hypothetical protein